MEQLSSMEHLELNRALEIHGACDKVMDHPRREWISKQRNESPEKGQDMPK